MPTAQGSRARFPRARHWLAVALCVAIDARVLSLEAQSVRYGVRVHYTSIGGAGGTEGHAFLPVSASAVQYAPVVGSCPGFVELRATARLTRGAVRGVTLWAALPAGRGLADLGAQGCTRAGIETELEDGSMLRGGQGHVQVDGPGAPEAGLRGKFSQTVLRNGVPVTVDGTFVLERPAGAEPH